MKQLSTVIMIFLISCTAFAHSGGVGNGGDALVCGDSVALLDSYEATKLGLTIDLVNDKIEKQTHRSMVSMAISRLSKKDIYTAKKLYEYALEIVTDLEQFKMFPNPQNKYKGNVLYLSADIVGEISDSKHRTLPAGCELRQLVSQKSYLRARENRYEMNKTLWDQLSVQDQAMTILHEAWYRIMIEDGAVDSVGTRYMNALIASKEFETENFSDYIKALQSTEKKHYIIKNNSTLVFDKLFKVNLKYSKLTFNEKSVCTRNLNVSANIKKVAFITNMHLGLAKMSFKDVCFNNSTIESLVLPRKLSGKKINFVMENYLIRTNGVVGERGVIKFNSNGTFKTLENLEVESLYKMSYVCGKRRRYRYRTFEKKYGCKGPYLHDKSRKKYPGKVIFDVNEVPIGFDFPEKP